MTERKPPGVGFETWIDTQIREATERGEMHNLPGAGKPLPGLDQPLEEHWWLKNYLAREKLSSEALLPEPLQLRKELERLPVTVRDLRSEDAVREVVKELNLRIIAWLRAPAGPQIIVGLADADEVVEQWRAGRAATPTAPAVQPVADETPRAGWWRRLTRKHR